MTTVIAILTLAILAIGLWQVSERKKSGLVDFANVAEGTHEGGNISRLADAAITDRFLVGKIGTDINHVALCGTGDIPIGIIEDEAGAAEDPVNVAHFGGAGRTLKGVASAAITAGDFLVPAANGQVRTLPGSSGTYYIIGRALTAAAAAADEVEFDPCVPVQRVV